MMNDGDSHKSGATHNVISRSIGGESTERGLPHANTNNRSAHIGANSESTESFVRMICQEHVSGWKGRRMTLSRLDGLSNTLFKVKLVPEELGVQTDAGVSTDTVLFRLYGQDVSAFYEPSYELEVFKAMSESGIGPKLIAKGDGWRIEEFHNGRPLLVVELQSPSIFTQIAAQLGRLHKLTGPHFLPNRSDMTPVTLHRLDSWTQEGIAALDEIQLSPERKARLNMDGVIRCVNDMKTFLASKLGCPGRIGYGVVFCHNDVQENNILLTTYGLRLIDFEYADFNFQAAEIGNFFNEFTIDNIDFQGMPEKYPSPEAQRLFAVVYLSEYLNEVVLESSHGSLISEFLDAVRVGSVISHLTWGLWSLVRARHGAVNGFDFIECAQYRFDQCCVSNPSTR